jgi:hypothetical protein
MHQNDSPVPVVTGCMEVVTGCMEVVTGCTEVVTRYTEVLMCEYEICYESLNG